MSAMLIYPNSLLLTLQTLSNALKTPVPMPQPADARVSMTLSLYKKSMFRNISPQTQGT
ncbi:uncharacterized protein CLUP02_09833 [Colletotrichum lupini]|uniref:Uncharacterized protein n=2 Tax=Colletotrichum acutatum species complex TaxID=2707335 RepID=A0A9Q8WIS9_9PEZI|nr:uncharacterized protein CLUP02_09833 [Colletotrichum lupini]KAK1496469.1 hypothetical protein CCUS01_02816 [Colletotrichum cuscutae]UQC84337.1 hypothetical protein CLUP02_09833 [Colletotrichum lupini]